MVRADCVCRLVSHSTATTCMSATPTRSCDSSTAGRPGARGAPEKLLDLPTGGHSTRNIVFNRAGTKLYIAVGSASNSDAGEDCRRAAILEVNPDGTGARIYGSGIRNPVGLTLQPGTDVVWTATNERDNLGDDLVPDYATSVKDGGFYGWPYSYIGRHYDPKYVGAFPDLVGRAIVPDVLLPAHSAPLGITFYTGSQFPARYRNGGFVALHGSWNRTVASGYRVVFFPMVNGKPGPIEDFLTGFLASTGENGTPVQQWGRPVGVTVAPDGALLVSDDSGNRIWRITASTAALGRSAQPQYGVLHHRDQWPTESLAGPCPASLVPPVSVSSAAVVCSFPCPSCHPCLPCLLLITRHGE